MKRVLMVAFHFPPLAGSSGIQRTLRFVQHLPEFGWAPSVLTAVPRAYERTSDDLLADVPQNVRVTRAFALDTARHLSIAGRYPGFLARPDRWRSWRWGAVPAGMRMLREERFDAIWSTYPIATAHTIGAALQRHSGLPWVADFRDPMAQDGYPADPKTWQSFKAIEQHAVRTAARAVFTTPGAAATYRTRYPELDPRRIVVIENGYDEETFAQVEARGSQPSALRQRVTLLHSGVVYPSERDPTQFVEAFGVLKRKGAIDATSFCMRFRASGEDQLLRDLARRFDVEDLIELVPPVPYRDALQEMMGVDGLVVLQASNCNAQIPAKLYEYLRTGRPILGFADPAGDTAQTLFRAGVNAVARLDSAAESARLIEQFIRVPASRKETMPSPEAVGAASRRARAQELAALLDGLA